METETPENTIPDADLHEALSQAIRAILWMSEAAMARLTPEKIAEVKRRLADGSGKLALFVTNDGAQVTASLAVIDAKVEDVFTQHLLKLHGPILTAAVPAEAVNIVNLRKMN